MSDPIDNPAPKDPALMLHLAMRTVYPQGVVTSPVHGVIEADAQKILDLLRDRHGAELTFIPTKAVVERKWQKFVGDQCPVAPTDLVDVWTKYSGQRHDRATLYIACEASGFTWTEARIDTWRPSTRTLSSAGESKLAYIIEQGKPVTERLDYLPTVQLLSRGYLRVVDNFWNRNGRALVEVTDAGRAAFAAVQEPPKPCPNRTHRGCSLMRVPCRRRPECA